MDPDDYLAFIRQQPPVQGVSFEEARAEAIAVWEAEQAFLAEAEAFAASRPIDYHAIGGRA